MPVNRGAETAQTNSKLKGLEPWDKIRNKVSRMTLKSKGANRARLVNKVARVVNRAARAASTIRAANRAASKAKLVNRAAKPDRSKGTIPRRDSFLSGQSALVAM